MAFKALSEPCPKPAALQIDSYTSTVLAEQLNVSGVEDFEDIAIDVPISR